MNTKIFLMEDPSELSKLEKILRGGWVNPPQYPLFTHSMFAFSTIFSDYIQKSFCNLNYRDLCIWIWSEQLAKKSVLTFASQKKV